jgi:hypothetical protein
VIYDYSPQSVGADDYDYETPYQSPADKKIGLFAQFEKLRIPSIAGSNLE